MRSLRVLFPLLSLGAATAVAITPGRQELSLRLEVCEYYLLHGPDDVVSTAGGLLKVDDVKERLQHLTSLGPRQLRAIEYNPWIEDTYLGPLTGLPLREARAFMRIEMNGRGTSEAFNLLSEWLHTFRGGQAFSFEIPTAWRIEREKLWSDAALVLMPHLALDQELRGADEKVARKLELLALVELRTPQALPDMTRLLWKIAVEGEPRSRLAATQLLDLQRSRTDAAPASLREPIRQLREKYQRRSTL